MELSALRKALSRQAATLRRAERALREAAALPFDLGAAAHAAAKVARDLEASFRELEDRAPLEELSRLAADLSARARAALEDAAARLAAEVATRLSPEAPLEGQLPELRWGLLRLEFRLAGPKPEVVVWYGPRIAVLDRAPPEAERVAAAARKARASLDREPLDPQSFLAQVREAYEAARRRRDLPVGVPVPILETLRELALSRQSPAFRADPVRENYQSYGRVRFSYDLYRAEHHGGIVLGVAAHAQTRRPEDHLWVPTSPAGDGTHFATLAVRAP
jgi:hypothetical protein